MTPISDLLDRALLREHPSVPRDIVPGQHASTIIERDHQLLPPAVSTYQADPDAAHDLQTLCETVVTHTAAASLREFFTDQIPEPRGARTLGCILQLTDAEDQARFWWQYAAGAGDNAASYCLYLHHLSLGEKDAAAWWRRQTQLATQPAPDLAPTDSPPELTGKLDTSTPTILRVLGRLTGTARSRTNLTDAVISCVSTVPLTYVDPDIQIPLPDPDFADRIAIISAVETALESRTPPARTPRLLRRQPETSNENRDGGGTRLQPTNSVSGRELGEQRAQRGERTGTQAVGHR